MTVRTWRHALLALVTALTAMGAGAEPPSRVARLGFVSGTVSLSPAGQPDWVRAAVNRPLTTGDQLWSDRGGRAEVQVGGAAVRLGPATSVTVLNLDDRITQLQLSQGTLIVRVRRVGPDEVFEVDTPNLALTLRRAGDYRIEVDPDDNATVVVVRSGEGQVYGDRASYAVRAKRGYRFHGTDLSDVESVSERGDDDLDRWARTRDRSTLGSVSARYVSPDLVGYEDLDAGGTWRTDPTYGPVWTPARVATSWTPYHDGRWAWVDPWGWTWIDDAPWGYAVSHYGRWARINSFWSWVPGPRRERAVYAPAMVAFVGGRDFQVSVSIGGGGGTGAGVGWFPLSPREVYRPSYPVSRTYFENINRSNAMIAPTTITNIYNTTTNTTIVNNTTNNVNVVYVNQQVAGAVVAVPAAAFAQAQPVARAAVRLSRESASAAPVAHTAAVVPMPLSVHGGAPDATARPPDRRRAVIARTAPPPPPIAFAAQQDQLSARPGRPIDEAQRLQLKPAAPAATAPQVNVVPAARAEAPTAAPPLTPPTGKAAPARRAETPGRDGPDSAAPRPERDRSPPPQAEATKDGAAAARAARSEAARVADARADAAPADPPRAAKARRDAPKAEPAKDEAQPATPVRPAADPPAPARARGGKPEAKGDDERKKDDPEPGKRRD